MSGAAVALITIGLFLLGLPLFAVLAAVTSLSLRYLADLPQTAANAAEYELARNMFRVLDQDALLAIPMFVLLGALFDRSGVAAKLVEPRLDGLARVSMNRCRITPEGKAFLRNICMAFDARLARKTDGSHQFSRTV